MYQSPLSLEEICLDSIATNLEVYVEAIPKTCSCCTYLNSEYILELKKYVFRDPDIFLIQQISEKLMCKLNDKGLLCDATLNLFSEQNTKLRSVKIAKVYLNECALKILKQHKITDLECYKVKELKNIIDCLNEWSQKNIVSLSLTKCTLSEHLKPPHWHKLTNLKNLRILNLAYVNQFNHSCFCIICYELKHLEKLDISGTSVRDLSPLLNISQLKSIGLADLPGVANFVNVMTQLNNLQYLDVSLINENLSMCEIKREDCVINLLTVEGVFPNLTYLDVSGWKDYIPKRVLYNFIASHTKLKYIGLIVNVLVTEPAFSKLGHKHYPSNLIIAGLANKEQIKVVLQKYRENPIYVRKALYHLFQLTNGTFAETCPHLFEAVLPVMAAHLMQFDVQIAATACLYNLTKGDLSKHIHPNLLSRGITLTLDAMAQYPQTYQLQKNSLLTLCNDRILQEINFNRFRCAWQVLDALCEFCDNNISRMAVAICSILAAKISTAETSKLGARPTYMRKLLDMVENRVKNIVSDVTLKFTLSALWNLTDESPATCTVFLEQQGAQLFLNVLQTFKDESTIETKVLGLLNNIAEVERLREHLMLDALIDELHRLLKSENIDVSYFAAGIVAHLASNGVEKWTVASYAIDEMLKELESSILNWQVPQSEMVAYRSFKPFFPLLEVGMDHRVQLWALWAIHHVCTTNSKRYCIMLKEENGDTLLNQLIEYKNSSPEIRNRSLIIMKTLAESAF